MLELGFQSDEALDYSFLLTSHLATTARQMLSPAWLYELLGEQPKDVARQYYQGDIELAHLCRFRKAALARFQSRRPWLVYLSDIQLLLSIGFHQLPKQIDQMILHLALEKAMHERR